MIFKDLIHVTTENSLAEGLHSMLISGIHDISKGQKVKLQTDLQNVTEKPPDEILFSCLIEYYERSFKLWPWCVLKILHVLTYNLPIDDQEPL